MDLEDDKDTFAIESAIYGEYEHAYDADNNVHDKKGVSYLEDPPIVKALGMVPVATFWVIVQPLARYSDKILGATSKALDTALQKLNGLLLDEPPKSEMLQPLELHDLYESSDSFESSDHSD